MKKLIYLLMTFIPAIGLSQANQLGPSPVDNVTMSSGTLNVYGTNIEATSVPTSTDHISGTAQVTLTGTQQVLLQPGFEANAFTGTGNFVGQIGTGAVTNAEVMGSSTDAYQYERYEIGLNLFDNKGIAPYNYIDQINVFINDPQNPP